MPWNKLTQLTADEERVIVHKGTEAPYSGKYVHEKSPGTYRCKRCGTALFDASTKFESGCGWPSFDDALPGAVREQTDADGDRTEILCATCGAHLGHVFRGERMTSKDTRHCVNSISVDLDKRVAPKEAFAYFAGGCFWGVEGLLEHEPGVLSVVSGYMGGTVASPTYNQVCTGRTGHAETVEVRYDPARTTYEALAKRFFEIHDPTQVDGQGPDIGSQYRSAIFVGDDAERATVHKLIGQLKTRGYDVATRVETADRFWPAEDYHQDYYAKTGKAPYCHAPVNRFGR